MSIKCKILNFSPNKNTRDKFLYRKQRTNFQSNSSFLAVQWPEKVKLMKSYFTFVNAIHQNQWFHYWDLIKIKILSNWFLGENPSAPSIKLYFRQKFTQSFISDWYSQDMTSLNGNATWKGPESWSNTLRRRSLAHHQTVLIYPFTIPSYTKENTTFFTSTMH